MGICSVCEEEMKEYELSPIEDMCNGCYLAECCQICGEHSDGGGELDDSGLCSTCADEELSDEESDDIEDS